MQLTHSFYAKMSLGLLVLLVAIVLVYAPGLRGPFVFDDYPNIVNNRVVAIDSLSYTNLRDAALSKETRILPRPLAMLSFAINYYLAQGFNDTLWFKATNLAIHLINTLLIFWVARLLLRGRNLYPLGDAPDRGLALWLPLFIASIWALHPLNLSTVLYTVQRMASLTTLFMLAGLISFLHGREILSRAPWHGLTLMIAGTVGGTGLGLLNKEIALLLPLYLLVVDYVFLRDASRGWPLVVSRFHTVTVAVIGLAGAYYAVAHSDRILGIYALREFTPWERLLTEPRVLWFYISLLVFPTPGRFTLFHDDIEFSTGLFSPWTTLPAIIGVIGIVVLAIVFRKRFPIAAFAVMWFMVGHILESSIIGLELVHEHRNYLPSFGPIFVMVYGLVYLFGRITRTAIVVFALLATAATVGYSTTVLAGYWSNAVFLTTYLAKNHPRSSRSQAMLGDLALQDGDPLRAIGHYKTAADLSIHETSFFLRIIHMVAISDIRGDITTPRADPFIASLPPYLTIRKDRYGTHLTMPPEIMAEAEQRLATWPVHSRTVEVLEQLANCVREDPPHCGHLRDAVTRWHQIALGNDRTNDNMRRALHTGLASLYVTSGKYKEALQSARRARSYDENSPVLALMEANILYLLGHTRQAEEILHVLELNATLDNINREQVEILLAMLKAPQKK